MRILTAKNTVAAVVITLVIGFVLFAVANWGRRIGVQSVATANVPYVVIVRKQYECIEARDWDCLRVSNEIQAQLLHIQLTTLRDMDLVEESMEEAVDEFLIWYESNFPED